MRIGLIVALLVSLIACAKLFLFTIRRQDRAKAQSFTILLVALTFYVVGYLLGNICVNEQMARIALCVENVGIPMIAPFFLLGILSLFYPKRIRCWMTRVALGYSFLIFVSVLFNDGLRLYYLDVRMRTAQSGNYFELSYGPMYVVQQVVSMTCVLAAYCLIIRRYTTGTRMIRTQMRMIILGSLVALVANVLNFSGLMSYTHIDPTPFAMTLAMLLFCIGMHRHRLLDLVPLVSSVAVETMDDAMVVLDKEHGFQFANRSAKLLFPEVDQLQGAEHIRGVGDWPQELLELQKNGEVTFLKHDQQGSEQYYRARVSLMRDTNDAPIGWSYLIRDITEHTRMMQQLEELATTDPLTGIFNRRQFLAMVSHELEIAARLGLSMSLIMYDLDHFKDVNDTYGHVAGDYVLCAVANIVKSQLRSYDIFARYGGEEFVIFSTGNEPIDLPAFADRLRSSIEKAELVYDGKPIKITASFGAVNVKPKTKFADAIREVDTAMYRAKTMGRNHVVVAEVHAEAE